ncbi:DUF6326 family protein [Sphingomonas sp. LB-2]|uniref:DUF6326 family protein n=1 Tax=Sphingomonas caeni TaxID=2984949 RepID=UPI00222FDC15|nr:DUF6326 family protein [Sphingomonas caeni]MCW3848749.1 DUF6326 family protein [Sphingomonas caeni]
MVEREGRGADLPVPLRVKLAALWAALMSLYIYNDYFQLYRPGTLARMAAGQLGPLGPATETLLIIVSVLLAVPALMIALSVLLPAPVSRWLNVLLGVAYTAVEVLTVGKSHPAYQMVVALEIATTLMIIWLAVRWRVPG